MWGIENSNFIQDGFCQKWLDSARVRFKLGDLPKNGGNKFQLRVMVSRRRIEIIRRCFGAVVAGVQPLPSKGLGWPSKHPF